MDMRLRTPARLLLPLFLLATLIVLTLSPSLGNPSRTGTFTVRTFLAKTTALGTFTERPDVDVVAGCWHARALWQGDMTYASALSRTISLPIGDARSAAPFAFVK